MSSTKDTARDGAVDTASDLSPGATVTVGILRFMLDEHLRQLTQSNQSAISDLKKEITDVKKDLGGRVDDLTRAMKALVKTTEVTMLKKATVMEIRYEVFVQEIKGRLAFANIPQQGEGNLPNFVPLHDLENVNMVGLPQKTQDYLLQQRREMETVHSLVQAVADKNLHMSSTLRAEREEYLDTFKQEVRDRQMEQDRRINKIDEKVMALADSHKAA